MASEVDSDLRVLFIHGGAFIMARPRHQRNTTSRFLEVTNVAVLAIDCRLMPEHRGIDGVRDCRQAYQCSQENGPSGEGSAARIYGGWDSAEGHLTLSLLAWARDRLKALQAWDKICAFMVTAVVSIGEVA